MMNDEHSMRENTRGNVEFEMTSLAHSAICTHYKQFKFIF